VAPTLRGQWYNRTVHLVDLHATILDLAGVREALHPPGTLPVDGFSLVPVLNLTRAIDSDIRPNNGELWISDDVLRIGDYKLITGGGTGPPYGMIGIGGDPVALPASNNDYSDHTGASACTGNEVPGSPDAMICMGCRCPAYSTTYNATAGCTPCIFNVRLDPGERINLASVYMEQAAAAAAAAAAEVGGDFAVAEGGELLASMTARLLELQRTRHDPVYPPDNYTAACDMMRANGGYFAPWAGPPPPPPPPIPPTVDCTFVGEMDQYPGSWQPGSRDGVASTSPEDCCKQCKKDLACFVGVFAALDGSPGLCYMKPNNATDRPREGCTSCYPKHSIDD